jgi:hypothetical protein
MGPSHYANYHSICSSGFAHPTLPLLALAAAVVMSLPKADGSYGLMSGHAGGVGVGSEEQGG